MVSEEYRERRAAIQTSTKNLSWGHSKFCGLIGVVG
jgi:hypothetical protein